MSEHCTFEFNNCALHHTAAVLIAGHWVITQWPCVGCGQSGHHRTGVHPKWDHTIQHSHDTHLQTQPKFDNCISDDCYQDSADSAEQTYIYIYIHTYRQTNIQTNKQTYKLKHAYKYIVLLFFYNRARSATYQEV